ncbi:hypothetical protein [Lunatibacter salilacus]|nr:hypothetical protein [Lunatibacter salilacus]
MCSKIFQIDISRNKQSEFIIFSNQKTHQDETVKEAQDYIEKYWKDAVSE